MESTIATTTTTQPMTRDSLAETLGEDRRRVSLREVDWSIYAEQGVLVRVSIGLCNWATKMRLEDWGIVTDTEEERKAYERTCSFGYRNTLPREGVIDPLVAIAGRGRALVERFSFPTGIGKEPGAAAARFMPIRLYARWRAENDKLRDEFMTLRDDLEANWDTYVAQMDEDYLSIARRNYRLLIGQGVQLEGTAEDYARLALERSKRRTQSKEAALAAFRWEWRTTGLPFEAGAEKAYRSALASGDVLNADLNKTRMEKDGGGLASLVADLTEQVRGKVYDVVVDCLTALRKNGGKMPPASTGQVRKLIETVQEMMFWPDSELEERLDQIRGLVDVPAESRSGEQITTALTALGVEMRSYLLEINRPPKRSAAGLGIPDSRKDLGAMKRRKEHRLDLSSAPIVETPAPVKRARKARPVTEVEAFVGPVSPSPEDGGGAVANLVAVEDLTTELVRQAIAS
jgi:hypothetical protein